MAIDRNKISKSAETHMAMGRVDRAIEEFLKLIEDKPDDHNLLNRVGDAYLQGGRVPEALDMFKKAGTGFERSGFNAKATAVLKKAHRIAGEDVDVAERLAELYRQTNMIKEAIQIHIEVAEICTRKGLFKRALEEFAKVVDLDPKNLKNKVKLADLYNKEGMKERAAGIYLEVAEALAMEQMHTEAGQILERAKAMVSTPQVFLTQSRLCVIQKDLPGAAGHLREGLAVNPRSPDLLDALAEVELQARAPERALEALAQVPQLAEKSLQLCERALRDLLRDGRVALGLELFKPIGRELARRGLGDAAGRTLRSALQQGGLRAEAWLQLAEIAHQGGNRAEEVEALRHACAEARAEGNLAVAEQTSQKLQGMGVRAEDVAAPSSAGPTFLLEEAPPAASQDTSQDLLRRMQVEKLQRDGAQYLQARHMDSALECFGRVLELEPANEQAISAIADIHRSSGMLTKVQMHYVKTAEKIAPLGFRGLAVELLDRAEAMFPGSTRLYRRTLGLMETATPLGPPVQTTPEAIPPEVMPAIQLDLDRLPWSFEPAPAPAPEPPAAAPRPWAAVPEPAAPEPPEYHWQELSDLVGYAPDQLPIPEPLPALTVPEPLPALTVPEPLVPQVPEPSPEPFPEPFAPFPVEPWAQPTPAGLPEALDEELTSTLSDIDFQLDYGSPEEALIEIRQAFERYPDQPELEQRRRQAEESLRRMGHDVSAEAPREADFAPSFFDLTDVLGDALLDSGDGEEMHDATNLVEKIRSVDELFNAFRAGVEQQVKGDDYDTHYNLGIAYKEMMLLEPAIEEFKTAMRDPERTLECCSMLSICEQTQGHVDAAIQWLRKGIEAPGFPPEDAIGLRYDLGQLLLAEGQLEEARDQFVLVHDQDPDYRGVASLIG
jgi:tetratricopeptide (TPR) repeat protein